jgi:hypothetical protein
MEDVKDWAVANCHNRTPRIDSPEYCVTLHQHSFVGELLGLNRGKMEYASSIQL